MRVFEWRMAGALLLCACWLPSNAADCPTPARCTDSDGCLHDARNNPSRVRPDADDPAASATSVARQPNGDIALKGDVELRQGDRILRAQEIEYRASTDDFWIPGEVQLVDPNLTLSGEGAAASESGAAQFDHTKFAIPARAGHGSAGRIRLSAEGEIDLHDVRYTTCPTPQPAWELKIGHLHVDESARIGTGTGIRVDFKGIPILYTPYISFPVGNEPKSGLLFPEFGHSSRSGWKFSLPWYWRIGDGYDATFTPSWYSSRGVDAGGEFRFLNRHSKGQLNVNYLPDDRETGTDRTFVELHEQTDFTSRLRFNADGVNLGDIAWFEDFGSATYTNLVALPRRAELIYRDDEWVLSARAENYQILDPSIARDDRPYTLFPQLLFTGYFPDRFLGLTAILESELTAFKRTLDGTTFVNSQRFDVRPELRLPLRSHGVYLEPAAALRYTTYRLDPGSLQSGANLTPSRTAPIFSVDGGMTLERETGSRNERVQTLEPRFLYAYVPYRNQDELPVFDTAPPDFNLIRLFQTERYAGPDRLGDLNHVALGVTSRLLGEDGRQVLSASVGELYRFAAQRVGLPGEPLDDKGSSDVIGELDLSAYRSWSAHAGVQWNPAESRYERTELGFQYRPDPGQVINLGYRYRRRNTLAGGTLTSGVTQTTEPGVLKQIDGSIAWPLGNAWSIYGRAVYSLEDHAAIERLGGFEYRSCCWGIRLLASRSVSSLTGNSDWEVKAQLELTGLSNVGNPVDAFLRESIQGYSAARNDFSSVP